MLPAHAPLPTASSFPFQPDTGSQTSILMSESDEGVSVAATRQNGGSCANGLPPPLPPRGFGAVNCPAATVCASVTATCGCENADRLSHVADHAGAASAHTERVRIACFIPA